MELQLNNSPLFVDDFRRNEAPRDFNNFRCSVIFNNELLITPDRKENFMQKLSANAFNHQMNVRFYQSCFIVNHSQKVSELIKFATLL